MTHTFGPRYARRVIAQANPAIWLRDAPHVGAILVGDAGDGEGAGEGFAVLLVDTRLRHLRESVLGFLDSGEVEAIFDDDEPVEFRRVTRSVAERGYGPLLYRTMIDALTNRGQWLSPGDDLSEAALRLWRRIAESPDYVSRDLPSQATTVGGQPVGEHGHPHLDALYQSRDPWAEAGTSESQAELWLKRLSPHGAEDRDWILDELVQEGSREFRHRMVVSYRPGSVRMAK